MPTYEHVRFGVTLPVYGNAEPRGQTAREARLAEALGFHDLWIPDRIWSAAPVREALTSGGIAIGATQHIRIGFGVLQAALRQPVWIAKAVRTLATESGADRIVLGLGAGGDGAYEWPAVRVPWSERGKRLDEMLPPLLQMLAGQEVDHQGTFYDLQVPPLLPGPDGHIDVVIGARTERTIRRASLVDGWMSVYASPTRFGRAATMLRNEAERIGGRPPSLTAGIFASVVGTEAEARARGVHHMTSTYGLTEEQGARSVVAGMGQLRELVDDYVRAGATAIRFGGADAAADAWPTIAKEFLD